MSNTLLFFSAKYLISAKIYFHKGSFCQLFGNQLQALCILLPLVTSLQAFCKDIIGRYSIKERETRLNFPCINASQYIPSVLPCANLFQKNMANPPQPFAKNLMSKVSHGFLPTNNAIIIRYHKSHKHPAPQRNARDCIYHSTSVH